MSPVVGVRVTNVDPVDSKTLRVLLKEISVEPRNEPKHLSFNRCRWSSRIWNNEWWVVRNHNTRHSIERHGSYLQSQKYACSHIPHYGIVLSFSFFIISIRITKSQTLFPNKFSPLISQHVDNSVGKPVYVNV